MKSFKNIAMIVPLAAMGMTQVVAETGTEKNNEAACSYYVVTASRLNIREQPDLASDIADTLPKDKRICVSDFSGKWAKIDKGWVSSKYILAEPKVVEATKVVEIAEEATQSDPNKAKDELKEETKALDINEEGGEAQAEAQEAEISPPLPVEKVETTTDTQEDIKEAETAEEAEPVTTEAKNTEELTVEKEDTATTDYLKQIRTQQGVRGTNYIYLFEGNGDKCEIMILEKNTVLANTCKPAVNESGEKMLCTWNKKMCKTEVQILKEINK